MIHNAELNPVSLYSKIDLQHQKMITLLHHEQIVDRQDQRDQFSFWDITSRLALLLAHSGMNSGMFFLRLCIQFEC